MKIKTRLQSMFYTIVLKIFKKYVGQTWAGLEKKFAINKYKEYYDGWNIQYQLGFIVFGCTYFNAASSSPCSDGSCDCSD